MKDLAAAIWNILRFIGKIIRFVRNSVINLLFLALCVLIVAAFVASKPKDLKDNSILVLDLSGDIVEEKRLDSPLGMFLEEALSSDSERPEIVLQDVLDAVQAAAKDQKIKLILLKLSGMGSAGLDQLQAIGDGLLEFRKTGKMVVAAEDLYTQKQYYLATFANTVLLNPMGGVDLHGIGVYPLYFQELIDKLLINYHVFKVGVYKSAVEPITRSSMSEEVKTQNAEWLNYLWKTYCDGVQSRKNLPDTAIAQYIGSVPVNLKAVGGDTGKLALKAGLVDRLMTRSEIRTYLKDLSGLTSGEELHYINLQKYLGHIETSFDKKEKREDKIGIVVMEGAIVGGKQPPGVIGSETMVEMLRKVRNDDAFKAVVLRINSGGGSAFASEIIRQEILELKKAGKPVVVSMGSAAASGGYWIAADADEIWAAPTTITGSIGIFGAIPTFEKSLKKLGIYSDGVGTSPLAAGLNLTQPLSPVLKETIQLSVENGYRQFLDVVANGRKIDTAKLNTIAEGRVFSGSKALSIGLVDKLGSLDDAIQATAKRANLTHYSAEYVQRPGSFQDQLMKSLKGELLTSIAADDSLVVSFGRVLQQMRRQTGFFLADDPHHIYAQSLSTDAVQ